VGSVHSPPALVEAGARLPVKPQPSWADVVVDGRTDDSES
jgi:hypothetical protein